MYPLRAMPHDCEPTSVMMDNGVVQNSAIARPDDERATASKDEGKYIFLFFLLFLPPSSGGVAARMLLLLLLLLLQTFAFVEIVQN